MKVQEAQEQDNIEIIEKSGHHEPNSQGYRNNCGCEGETRGGNAYRDLVIKFEKNNRTIRKRFYHQSRVITVSETEKGNIGTVDVNTHGYGDSSTTRERINKELPSGFRMVQRDYVPMLQLPSGDCIDVPRRFKLDFEVLDGDWVRVTNWNGSELVADVNLQA